VRDQSVAIEPVDTRGRLLAAARELFAAHGFDATSIRELAGLAECNPSLIAHYFGSKEGLLGELLRSELAGGRFELAKILAAPISFARRVDRWVDFMVDKFAGDRAIMLIIHREILSGSQPEALKQFVDIIDDRVRLFASIFEEARVRGELRADLDPRFVCMLLHGMVQYYFIHLRVTRNTIGPPDAEVVAELKRHILETFLRGVAVPAHE
jgi:AcrR family transcriptional regulator